MRRPLFAGNWKLNKTIPEAVRLAGELKRELGDVSAADILICPPFTALSAVGDVLAGSPLLLGGQDLYWEKSGAFTGAVSGPLLADAGCRCVIIGHSERRQYFGETDAAVNRKAVAALESSLTPVVCVGEPLEKREQGVTKEFIRKQLEEGIRPLGEEKAGKIVIAYEPIWAIGTGKTATPQIAQETHAFIRSWLAERFGPALAAALRLLYGGSVKPDNSKVLMAEADIDGFLVGGASLEAKSFIAIVRNGLA
jgi:triosephosphate isomerase